MASTYLMFFSYIIYNSTNTIGEKGCNVYLRLRDRSRTIYVTQFSCSIFHPDKFEQTCAQVTTGKYLNEATTVTVTVCFARIIYTSHNYY
jgi:hypothetical protein